ncbi:unnamed protein product [Notodromas monacha]|uniref:Alkaline phosphatase n=1 Tax=Notodromas monacha TaxID=399045 RepID=A0A7R9GEH5_9CRUS|nr:unnamed protein product [Notodromas monacha]CAG0919630.1 unnamed protein product [Notodromas monacha]
MSLWSLVSLSLCAFGVTAIFDPFAEDRNFFLNTKSEELWRILQLPRHLGIARNVIIFLGDGMGIPVITASRIYKGQQEGNPGEETYLNFETFPYSGMIRTYCVDKQVPDSSCTATALLTGVNAPFGTVGLDSHGRHLDCSNYSELDEDHLPISIMTHAQNAGKKTGGLWRREAEFPAKKFGIRHSLFFTAFPELSPYRCVTTKHENHMEFESEKKKPVSGEPTLAEMTEAAIELLQNPNGFVLLVEGGRIDHALHCTNAKRAILETLALEKAINIALLSTNPVDTLILVGADHSHVMTINGYPKRGNPILGLAGTQADYKLPYTTLMFANGHSYNYRQNGTHILWRNVSSANTNDLNFRQQAGTFQPEGFETHGGEDVAFYANGPWSHLISGSHDLAYVGHVLLFAACLGDYEDACGVENNGRSKRTKTMDNNVNTQEFDTYETQLSSKDNLYLMATGSDDAVPGLSAIVDAVLELDDVVALWREKRK